MFTSRITRIIASLSLLVTSLMFQASPVMAAGFSLRGNIDCAKAATSAVCQSTSNADPITGPTGILRTATKLIATFAGAVAVIIMILAGIRYITSSGDPEEVSRAKKTIIFASVGLVVILAGQAIINFVISKV